MKRFWETASVVREGSVLAIRLDGKPLRMQGVAGLALAGEALAEAIAAEWQAAGVAKGGDFDPEDLPLTRLAATAQGRVAPHRGPMIGAMMRFAESDLLCYRAPFPPDLAARQHALWQPWLDWAARLHGADLRVVHGLMPHPQPPEAINALRSALASRTTEALAALAVLVPSTGSLILGLAVADGALGAADAVGLVFLDEDFQARTWGEDPASRERRRRIAKDIDFASRFIQLSASGTIPDMAAHLEATQE